jgi:ribosomal protein L7Ae-like RNA K-turn-binding protein
VTDRLAALLGLGHRGGQVVIGVMGVRARLQQGRLAAVVLAADASARTREKVERLARARGVPVLSGPSADRLGAQLGRPPVQAVGIADPALARGVRRLSEELRGDTDS